jgi:hypothetical protein
MFAQLILQSLGKWLAAFSGRTRAIATAEETGE